MHDGVGSGEALHRLTHVGQVHAQERRERLPRRDEIDTQDVMLVLEQAANNRATRLPARTGHDHLHRPQTIKAGARERCYLIVTGMPGLTRATSQRMASLSRRTQPCEAAVPGVPPTFISP